MTTPPTPAEVAEARAWFEANPGEVDGVDWNEITNGTTARNAAVLVRAALAAPAKQSREDDHPVGIDSDGELTVTGYYRRPDDEQYGVSDPYDYPGDPDEDRIVAICQDIDVVDVDRTGGSYEQVRGLLAQRDWRSMVAAADAMGLAGDWGTDDVEEALANAFAEFAARPVSPSAVPAVSAGGAGRDLTADDLRSVLPAHGWGVAVSAVADRLNAIARPADTGTQATEQTTEPDGCPYVVALRMDDGSPGDLWNAVTYPTVESAAKVARAAGRSVYELTEVPVSPWSPVAVHDKEQQR